jgi:group I intron endonuclease
MRKIMSEVIWSIYRITNLLNNKVYIGQSKNPKTRWSRHKSDARYGKNNHLSLAIKKYGIENFEFTIIIQTKLIDEVDNLEKLCILQYNSTDYSVGYNISSGGQACKLVSKETREKMSNKRKGKPSPMLGKHHTDETKLILSESNKGNTFRLGTKVSIETKNKLSEINIGKKASKETIIKMSNSMIGKNKGSNNGMFNKRPKHAKLSQDQANEIRIKYTQGISSLKLSKRYNVSKKTILNIIHEKIYICHQ